MNACMNPHAGDSAGTVAALLAARVDPDIEDSRGRTALFFAAKTNHPELVKTFKGVAKNVNPHETYGVTALAFAVRDGHVEVIKALLDMNADPNYQDSFGGTPLAEAKASKNPVIRQLFNLSTDDLKPTPTGGSRRLGEL